MPKSAVARGGGLQAYGIVSPALGLKDDLPSILVKDRFSIDGINTVDVFYRRGMVERVTKRLAEFSQTLPDNVLLIDQFWKKDQTFKLMVATKRDLAYRDAAGNRFVYVTPKYSTGTIQVVNGSAVVTGSSTAWTTSGLAAGDFITIGTTYSTDDTWYEILTVDSDTQITLTVVYAQANGGPGLAYQARKTYNGTATDYWRAATFNLTDEWIATNGIDNLQVYTGSGQAADVSGSPPKCRGLTVYENYLVLFDITSGGNRFPQRFQWPNLATTTGWATGDAGSADIDGVGSIKAAGRIQGFLIFLSDRSIDKVWLTTAATVFERRRIADGIGCDAGGSVIQTHRGIYFHASDNTFRFFDGFSWPIISSNVRETAINVHPTYLPNIQGHFNEEYQLCLWAIPTTDSSGRLDRVLLYDNEEKTWGVIDVDVVCFGAYEQETTYTWNTLPFSTWDSWAWDRWDSRFGLANSPIDLIGGYDGKVYRFFGAETDDGTAYTGKVTLDVDLGSKDRPHLRKRVLYIDVYAMREGSGTLSLLASPDYAGFQSLGSVSLDGDGEILKQRLVVDFSAKNFLFQASGANHFRFIGAVFWFVEQGYR